MPTVQALVEGYGPDFPSLEELFGLEPTEQQRLMLSQPTPEQSRYFKSVAFMCEVTSQRTVSLTRFRVMIEYFIALSQTLTAWSGVNQDEAIICPLSPEDETALRELGRSDSDILRAEIIEKFTEHDTAAAGDYLKLLIGTRLPHLEPSIEGVCFALTSEDTMGPVFGLIGNSLVYGHLLPKLLDFMELLVKWVDKLEGNGPLIIPALTHQQAAEPTTFDKEVATFLAAVVFHLDRMMDNDEFIPFTGKLGGAVGNLTNHFAVYPRTNWRQFAERFIEGLGLTYEHLSYQSSAFAVEATIFTELGNIFTHILKFIEDFLRLASCPGQIFVKRKKKGTKGSSIMFKSNAWAIEGAREMLIEARDNLFRLAQRLPAFPHDGDMGRSYLMRSLGKCLMPAFIALDRITSEMIGDMETRGYAPNPEKIASFFREYPGMAGSSIQTILKQAKIEGDAYRAIEGIAINSDGTYANAEQFASGLERVMTDLHLSGEVCAKLRKVLDPSNNIGDADKLARRACDNFVLHISRYRDRLENHAKSLV